MTEEERKAFMYTGISMRCTSEVNLRWARSQMLILVNLGGVTFLGTPKSTLETYPWLGGAGIVLVIFWFIINWKTQLWIDYWHYCLAKMEPSDTNILIFRVFTGTKWKLVNKWPTFNFLLNLMPSAFMILWIYIFSIPFYEKWFSLFFNLFRGGAV